jgi:4-amino-4-deoxy-L-arabinose transferase-like glycosyltransferase
MLSSIAVYQISLNGHNSEIIVSRFLKFAFRMAPSKDQQPPAPRNPALRGQGFFGVFRFGEDFLDPAAGPWKNPGHIVEVRQRFTGLFLADAVSLLMRCLQARNPVINPFSHTSFREISRSIAGLATPRLGWVLVALTLAQFCLSINSSWKASPDSALYLELGQSLARGNGYLFNGEPHTYVPPAFPALLAVATMIGGESFLTYRILMALLGLLAAGAGYLLVYRMCGKDTAFLAGGLFVVNHTLLFNSTLVTSDVPFALFTLVALNAVLSAGQPPHRVSWTVFAGLLCGLPTLLRVNGWGLPPAAAVFLFFAWYDRKAVTRLGWLAVFLVLAFLPPAVWQLCKAGFPSSYTEGSYFHTILGRGNIAQLTIILTSAWEYVHETAFALAGVSLRTGIIEWTLVMLCLVGGVTAFLNGERLLIPFTLIQFCGLFLSPAGSRYLIPVLPGLYLFLALGFVRVVPWMLDRLGVRTETLPRGFLVGSFALLAVLNVGHNALTIVHARTALESGGAESSRDLPFFIAARWLKEHTSGGVVLTMHPRVIHYLSRFPTVELIRSGVPEHEVWVNTQDQIRRLIAARNPTFFFSDAKDSDLFKQVIAAAESLNLRLEEIPEAGSPPRFTLWRLRPYQTRGSHDDLGVPAR